MLFTLAEELKAAEKKWVSRPKKQELAIEERQARNIEMGRPKNSHLPWSDEEKDKLVLEYVKSKSVSYLANVFGRSILSIAIQLHNVGLLTKTQVEGFKSNGFSKA